MVSVALVLKFCTRHVSIQYLFFLDKNYTTIDHLCKGKVPGNWKELVTKKTKLSTDQAFDL